MEREITVRKADLSDLPKEYHWKEASHHFINPELWIAECDEEFAGYGFVMDIEKDDFLNDGKSKWSGPSRILKPYLGNGGQKLLLKVRQKWAMDRGLNLVCVVDKPNVYSSKNVLDCGFYLIFPEKSKWVNYYRWVPPG